MPEAVKQIILATHLQTLALSARACAVHLSVRALLDLVSTSSPRRDFVKMDTCSLRPGDRQARRSFRQSAQRYYGKACRV
jgi:hypothetical protein